MRIAVPLSIAAIAAAVPLTAAAGTTSLPPAARAAAYFGDTNAQANASTQYIIDTPHGNSTSGFATQWCSYHGAACS